MWNIKYYLDGINLLTILRLPVRKSSFRISMSALHDKGFVDLDTDILLLLGTVVFIKEIFLKSSETFLYKPVIYSLVSVMLECIAYSVLTLCTCT
jgi:hypothetical protein